MCGAQGIKGGERKLAAILANDSDDYQRALYHCLSGRCDDGGVLDLSWLEDMLKACG